MSTKRPFPQVTFDANILVLNSSAFLVVLTLQIPCVYQLQFQCDLFEIFSDVARDFELTRRKTPIIYDTKTQLKITVLIIYVEIPNQRYHTL